MYFSWIFPLKTLCALLRFKAYYDKIHSVVEKLVIGGFLVSYDRDSFTSLEKFRYNEDDLISVIQSVIFENVGLIDVDLETKFSDDLKMDEPTKIEILLAIEHAIGFKVDNKALNEVNSIKDAVALYKILYEEVEKDKRKTANLAPFKSKIVV